MSQKGKKLSHVQSNRLSNHKDQSIKGLKAEIAQLQRQVKEIKSGKILSSQSIANKENQQSAICKCHDLKEQNHKKLQLLKLNEQNRFFDAEKVNGCVEAIGKIIENEVFSSSLNGCLNNLLTVIEYQFIRIQSQVHEKQFEIQELEKISSQIKSQFLSIQRQKQQYLFDIEELHLKINDQEQLLSDQILKIDEYQTIVQSYQNSNLQLTHQLHEAEKVIKQLNTQIDVYQSKNSSQSKVEVSLKEKIDVQIENYLKIQGENQFYRQYLEDVFINVRKMEKQLTFCRSQLSKWKERCFKND